jgi:quercetin dioxygenase-like cupin family protein
MKTHSAIWTALALVAMTVPLAAQQMAPPVAQTQGIKRIPLQKFDVPPGVRETVMGIAEIAPNSPVARHTHPGPEVSYVLEGELVLKIDGQPDKTVKAGDSFHIPPGTPHAAQSGAKGAKVLATYIIEKGKPLASPAP